MKGVVMASVLFDNVTKVFDDHQRGKVAAVKDMTLEIKDREFLVLVGPSGCGKTTSLRMIAGLEVPTQGNILIGDHKVTRLHPGERDVAMVFQDYALYPHMSVYDNMSFALRNLKYPRAEIKAKVKGAAGLLGIEALLDRRPRQLSGGQRQRVALGRAIVRNPKVFLFDEPLSNLDAGLRMQMRVELAELHQRLGTTMVYVTHDQVEAMTLGERIVVMENGHIRQIATPEDLYNNPANLFVATFIGAPPMNIMTVKVAASDGGLLLDAGDFRLKVPRDRATALERHAGREVVFGLRPECILDASRADWGRIDPANRLNVKIEVVERLGKELLVYFNAAKRMFVANLSQDSKAQAGAYQLAFDLSKMRCFDPVTTVAIG
jgi:multiple sugar transport system ATP-binding protein